MHRRPNGVPGAAAALGAPNAAGLSRGTLGVSRPTCGEEDEGGNRPQTMVALAQITPGDELRDGAKANLGYRRRSRTREIAGALASDTISSCTNSSRLQIVILKTGRGRDKLGT
jgi:hypothetical protein